MAERNFHITEKFPNMVDPQKTNLWDVEFVTLPKCLTKNSRWNAHFSDKMKFRATGVSIPDRKIAYTSSKFLGHTLNFPLPSDDGGKTIDIEFVEREDQTVITALNSWIHEIYDMGVLRNDWYIKFNDFKHSFTAKISIRQYGLNGELLPSEVNLYNAFITSISQAKLDYGRSDAVKYTATFAFDYWSLERTKNFERDMGKGD